MATVKGTNKTLIDTGGMVSQIAAGLVNGRVKCDIDEYVADGEAIGTVIEMFSDLPAGAKILALIFSSTVEQTSVTFKLGTSYNDDEFAATGNSTLQAILNAWVEHGKGYVVGTADDDGQIILTTEGSALVAGTINGAVLYTTD